MIDKITAKQSNLFISVVVPVFNDSKRLKTCLEALENQTYPKSLYEVVVVDNGSDESEDIKGVVSQFSQAIAAHESRCGSYAARNKGISLAKGSIIAFTDADCIPASDWIEKGVANLLRVPSCGLVAGKVEFFFKKPDQPTAVEFYDSLTAIPQKRLVEEYKYGATANLFTFKSVLDDVGCFDDTLKSGGDGAWGKRVFSSGYQVIFADDTRVSHPARYSYGQIYKQMARITGGWHDQNMRNSYSFVALIRDLVTKDLRPPINTIFRIISGDIIFPYTDQRANGSLQKLKLIFILFFVRFTIASERIHLYLGGSSQRE